MEHEERDHFRFAVGTSLLMLATGLIAAAWGRFNQQILDSVQNGMLLTLATVLGVKVATRMTKAPPTPTSAPKAPATVEPQGE